MILLLSTLPKRKSSKKAIIYQYRSKNYSKRNNEYKISISQTSHKVMKERMLARRQTNFIDVIEKIIKL